MSPKAPLGDLPALAGWFAAQTARPDAGSADQLLYGLCEALQSPADTRVRTWTTTFRVFLNASMNPLQDFLKAEARMNTFEAPLLDLVGEIGETAVKLGDTDEFFLSMQQGADVTGLIVFRFLSAWTALNAGKPELCVDECEKVTEPFSSIHTLHGQALLEIGRPADAIDALDIATKLAPSEILAWFQKAKALHVVGRHHEAFSALGECNRLAPQSDEVALYMGMIAVEQTEAALWGEAYQTLRPRLTRLQDGSVTLTLMRLAAMIGDKGKASSVIKDSTWSGKLPTGDSMQSLATTLRLLGDRGWMDVAASLMTKVTQEIAS